MPRERILPINCQSNLATQEILPLNFIVRAGKKANEKRVSRLASVRPVSIPPEKLSGRIRNWISRYHQGRTQEETSNCSITVEDAALDFPLWIALSELQLIHNPEPRDLQRRSRDPQLATSRRTPSIHYDGNKMQIARVLFALLGEKLSALLTLVSRTNPPK